MSLEEEEPEDLDGPLLPHASGFRTRRSSKKTKEQAQVRWNSQRAESSKSDFDPSVMGDKCGRCRNLNPKHFGPTTKGVSHYLDKDLELAVSNGCELCKVLSAGFGEPRGTAELRFDNIVSIVNYYFRGGRGKLSASFDVFGPEDQNSDTPPLYRPIASHPDNESCFSLIRRWMANCVTSHRQCKQPAQYQLPTRVIDLAGHPPRLVTKPLHGQRYNALSYCWGTFPQPITTRQNLKSRETSLDLSKLPKTFKDAITVTRKLGVDYLWIDALCIIQDSDQDKAIECSNMGMYYRNSYVTVSALAASSSSEGFLKPRQPTAQARLFEKQNLYIRPKTLTRAAIFQQAPLSQRGWTLQERLLSTRILHYGHTEVFWECLTCSCREGSTKEHYGNEDVRDLATSEGEDFKRINFAASADPKDPDCGAFALWYRLISQFSRRSLTYQDDALPAMSGLASSMAGKLNLRYIAGLWAEDLDGLLWQVEQRTFYEGKASRNKRVSGIPTWSWASLSAPVVYPFIHEPRATSASRYTALFKTSGLNVDPANPFGKVTDGSISLHALLARDILFTFDQSQRQKRDNLNRLNDMHVEVYRTWEHPTHARQSGTGYLDELCTYSECYVEDEAFHWTDSPGLMKEREVAMKAFASSREFGMVCMTERMGSHGPRMEEEVEIAATRKVYYFLIVLPVHGHKACWRRVGMGWTNHKTMFDGCQTEEINLV